jgi:hypothetical protein
MDAEDRITLLIMRGAVAELAEEDRAKVQAAAALLRDTVAAYGDHGLLALALVGAETQVAAI